MVKATKDSKDLRSAVSRHEKALDGRADWETLPTTAFGDAAKKQQCSILKTDIGRARLTGNSRQYPFTKYVVTWQQFLLGLDNLESTALIGYDTVEQF